MGRGRYSHNLVHRVSDLTAPSITPGGKMRDPGNDVDIPLSPFLSPSLGS